MHTYPSSRLTPSQPGPAALLSPSLTYFLIRSSLPSEALEEFLSILRPSLFPPRSPILRPLRYPVSSLHDRTLTLPPKPLGGIDNLTVLPRDDSRTPVKQSGASLSSRAPQLCENEENDVGPETPTRFFSSGPLGMPFASSPSEFCPSLAPITRIADVHILTCQ